MTRKNNDYGATFVLDTNVILRAIDDGRFAEHARDCLASKGSSASEILIPSKVVSELERHSVNTMFLSAVLSSKLGIDSIVFDTATHAEGKGAKWLEGRHETLHRGDSEILAFTHARGHVLVTCDKGLLVAARDVGVRCINPDARKRRDGGDNRDTAYGKRHITRL